jgi:hypothetical protein
MLADIVDSGNPTAVTDMRVHELALQRWLNQNFYVTEGYPVPVVFTAPMDAFAHFQNLWARDNNPFTYLLAAKDSAGTPLYEPHPSPARYPIISVHRRGWRPRVGQNYSTHSWRHLGWPTIVSSGTVVRQDLANVLVSRMPQAWDFMFQVDFFCLRPDTLAIFVAHMMRKLYRTGGATPQTWLAVAHPFYGSMLSRMYLDGDITNLTPDEPNNDVNVEHRISLSFVVEGWVPDINIQEVPVVWGVVFNERAEISPDSLETVYTQLVDLHNHENAVNPVMATRPNVPKFGQ